MSFPSQALPSDTRNSDLGSSNSSESTEENATRLQAVEESEVLYLFSSNQTPLYSQDILDLLAAPRGLRYRFRYKRSWVQKETAERWRNLKGVSVLVHFAIQQRAQFHAPAYIPIREGRVSWTDCLGDFYLLEFELGGYVALEKKDLPKTGELLDSREYGEPVRQYTAELARLGVPRPYESWAGLGVPTRGYLNREAPEISKNERMRVFEQATGYLHCTETFRNARYFRVLGIQELRADSYQLLEEGLSPVNGRYSLTGGKTYSLLIGHSQPESPASPERFVLTLDSTHLRSIGSPYFEISSRYDLLRLEIHVLPLSTAAPRETLLAIDPAPGIQGPRVRLLVHVQPDHLAVASGVGGAAVAALLLGVPSIVPTLALGWKAAAVLAASVIFATLAMLGLKKY